MTSLPSWSDYGTYDESAYPDLWNGVVGYWAPCLGPTGLRLHDVSRYANWGTLTQTSGSNLVDWVLQPTMRGSFYAIRGKQNAIVECTNSNSLNIRESTITVAVWWNYASHNDWQALVYKSGGNFAGYQLFVDNLNQVQWGTHTTGSGFGRLNGGLVNTSGLNHIVCTLNQQRRVYINGAITATSGNVSGTITDSSGFALWLSGFNFGDQYNRGSILDVVISTQPWNAAQVQIAYQLGPGGMLQRRSRRRAYVEPAGFRAHYASQRSRIIGGGLK